MFRPQRSETQKKNGVLIDFDLAVNRDSKANDNDQTLTHRTGTLPFLAINILHATRENPPLHIYRFDLESFVYVFLWDAVCYPEGKSTIYSRATHPLRHWVSADVKSNVVAKLTLRNRFRRSTQSTTSFENLCLPELNICSRHLRDLVSYLNADMERLDHYQDFVLDGGKPDGSWVDRWTQTEVGITLEQAERELFGLFIYDTVKATFLAIKRDLDTASYSCS